MAKDLLDAVYGCLIGAAIGDALGAPVAGLNYWEIREEYGRLEDLVASSRANTNQLPGGVTGATVLRQYVGLAIVRKEGRITPDDLAALWIERGNSELFGASERVVHEKLMWGTDPWDCGRGGNLPGAATMAMVPVGIINAANPAQAYQDGYALASLMQDGHERDAAAILAAGVATAIVPGHKLADVMAAMDQHGSDLVRRAISLTLDLALTSGSTGEFIQSYYAQLTDWRMAQPPHQVGSVPEGYPPRARYLSSSSLERLPAALALLHLCGGDVNDCLIEGANFGRDAAAIASIAGCIAGALAGSTLIRGDWIDTCETANRGLWTSLEQDSAASFYSMAWRLARVLKAERNATEARLKVLDRLLGR
jgi:ADP-ribosylglycohydrolase